MPNVALFRDVLHMMLVTATEVPVEDRWRDDKKSEASLCRGRADSSQEHEYIEMPATLSQLWNRALIRRRSFDDDVLLPPPKSRLRTHRHQRSLDTPDDSVGNLHLISAVHPAVPGMLLLRPDHVQ